MNIDSIIKEAPKKNVTIKLSLTTISKLQSLSKELNKSQGKIIEELITLLYKRG